MTARTRAFWTVCRRFINFEKGIAYSSGALNY